MGILVGTPTPRQRLRATPTLTLRSPAPGDDLEILDRATGAADAAGPFHAPAERQGYAHRWPDHRELVAEVAGEVVGRVLLHDDTRRVLLVDLVVLPAHRRQGFAGEVIRRAKEEALAQRLPLECAVSALHPALGTLLRHGLRIVAERPPHLLLRWEPDPATT